MITMPDTGFVKFFPFTSFPGQTQIYFSLDSQNRLVRGVSYHPIWCEISELNFNETSRHLYNVRTCAVFVSTKSNYAFSLCLLEYFQDSSAILTLEI